MVMVIPARKERDTGIGRRQYLREGGEDCARLLIDAKDVDVCLGI